jgi:hypothetical protein
MENRSDFDLPIVAGRGVNCSLSDMERRALIFLKKEQEKIAPDPAMIAFLCDVVRLSREYEDGMARIGKALARSEKRDGVLPRP